MVSRIYKLSHVLLVPLLLAITTQAVANDISEYKQNTEINNGHALSFSSPGRSQGEVYEHVLSYDVKARFNNNGVMDVSEKIQVQSLGEEIRRGIFRTLPLVWRRQDGKEFDIKYHIKNVLRDGVKEPFSIVKDESILTVRIGSADHLLKPGIYNYILEYQVSNHFSRFPDWDELYWNVTGNDWAYSIDKVSFQLELPDAQAFVDSKGKDSRLKSIDIYTGFRGRKEKNAYIRDDGSIQTLQPLSIHQGLTAVYTWPRSILAHASAPQASSSWRHLLLPTWGTCVVWLPVFLLIGYVLRWRRQNITVFGLKMSPIVPLYALPVNMSPGYLRYIIKGEYDNVAFSSDLLNLVSKRGIAITQKKILSLATDTANNQLNADDQRVLEILFPGDEKEIDLDKPHQKSMIEAKMYLKRRSHRAEEELFFQWTGAGFYMVLLGGLIPAVAGLLYKGALFPLGIFALISLAGGIFFCSISVKSLFGREDIVDTRRVRVITVLSSLIMGLLCLLLSCILLFLVIPFQQIPAGYIGALLTAIVLFVIVLWKVPRYTAKGLHELAIAKGLKLYLGTGERHRYKTLYPPDKWISHFENMLPVAFALDVGQTWANTFAQHLISTGAMSEVFADADWDFVHHFSQSCGLPSVEKSSSSGSSFGSSSGSGSSGRGSSGGGSGGGGGGGW